MPSKRAAWAKEPPTKKRPSVADPTVGAGRFSWRLGRLDRDFPKAWVLDAAWLNRIHGFLSGLETMTLAEACQSGAKAKVIRVKDMPAEAQRYLRATRRDDTAELVELILGNKPRIWGIQIGPVCYILWWDPDHEVWPSTLRYT